MSDPPLLRVAISDALETTAAAIQCGHVCALHAATGPRTADWAATTLVLHQAPLDDLVEAIRHAGGEPARSGQRRGMSWFVEPDLLWEPTAVAAHGATPLAPRITGWDLYRHPPLLGGPPANGQPDRRWLARLAADCSRVGLEGPVLWAQAREFGDPGSRQTRVRAAHLLVRGKEPPLAS